uniref:Uncharacterized protein n=1 Tax=Anguilla anguilla TaxID=7936 RepID=A0A0E9WFH4_ANGAN
MSYYVPLAAQNGNLRRLAVGSWAGETDKNLEHGAVGREGQDSGSTQVSGQNKALQSRIRCQARQAM